MAQDKNIVRLFKEKLNLLLDVAQTVNEDSTVEELMGEFESLVKDKLGVGRLLVFTLEETTWRCILQSGVTDEQRDEIVELRHTFTEVADVALLAMADIPSLRGFDAVIPLRHKREIMGYVMVGDTELGDGVSPTLRNLKFIQILANITIVFIENKKMQARLLRQERLRQELAVASRIQAGLIPSQDELSQTGFLRILSYYHPHDQVGGDYYDILPLGGHVTGFCIADVSGKGVAAALLMSNFQAMVRALFTAQVPLRSLVENLNSRICQNAGGEKFITCFIGRYNSLTGRLSYVNAGHLPPLVNSRGVVSELSAGSIGLGMLDKMPGISVGSTRLRRGDFLAAYTDGLEEVDEGDRIVNHHAKLVEIMRTARDVDGAMASIAALAKRTREAGEAFDDTSVLAMGVTRGGVLPF